MLQALCNAPELTPSGVRVRCQSFVIEDLIMSFNAQRAFKQLPKHSVRPSGNALSDLRVCALSGFDHLGCWRYGWR